MHISPSANLAGGVNVGDCSRVGIGASVREGIKLEQHTTVGAGAAIASDVSISTTTVGALASPLRTA